MSEFDFHDYLSAIALHYGQQRDLYTLTDALLPLEARSVERAEQGREQRVEQFPVLAGLQRYALGDDREHVLLAGRPGSGKSTALRQLVVELAAAPQPPILGEHEGSGSQIPVLVQLKGDRTVPELIQAEFRRMKLRVTLEQIDEWLMHDRLILLLDGVNEMPTEELRRSLAQFREDNRTVPMIFTTRDLSLGGDLGIGKRLEMKPLSEGQLREFVGKYLPEQGDRLLGQLRDRLREIAETPLLLKMLCDVFGQTGEIPANKGELFRLFDREYEKFKSLPAVSADFRRFKPEILQHLAFVMMQGDESKPTEFWLTIARSQAERSIEQWLTGRVSDPGVRAKEWLEDLLEHHLLQVAADGRRVEFHHQLFQEYYAAEALLGMFADRHPDVVEPERFQHFYLNYLKWTESVAIGLSLMEDEETTVDLVQQALDVDLMLGARLAGEVRSGFQPQSIKLVEQKNVCTWLRYTLLERAEFASIPMLLKEIVSLDDTVRYKAAEVLGRIGDESNVPALCQLLNSSNQSVKISLINVLGNIRSQNSTPYLLDLLMNGDSSYREIIVNALGKIASIDAVPILKKILISDSSWFIRLSAAEALGNIGSEDAIPELCAAIEGEHRVRISAQEALKKIKSDQSIPNIRQLFDHYNQADYHSQEIRRTVIRVLRAIATPQAVEELGTIQHLDPETSQDVVYALIEIESEQAIKILERLVENPIISNTLRIAANDSGTRNARLINLFKSIGAPVKNTNGISQINEALLEYQLDDAEISHLINEIQTGEHSQRWDAAHKLCLSRSINIIPGLLFLIQFPDLHLRMMAAQTLGSFKGSNAADALPKLRSLLYIEVTTETAFRAIQGIQANCKFYNYKIFHSPPAKPQLTQPFPQATTINQYPNVTEVKIFENVQTYHASPPRDPPP